jgi:hypothetical protein
MLTAAPIQEASFAVDSLSASAPIDSTPERMTPVDAREGELSATKRVVRWLPPPSVPIFDPPRTLRLEINVRTFS